MRLLALIAAVGIVVSGAGCGEKASGNKRIGLKSAIVEYAMGGLQKGTQTLYTDQWGAREARHTQSELTMLGRTIRSTQISILDGDWLYSYDPGKKTGTRMKSPLLQMKETPNLRKTMTQWSEELARDMGGEKTGTEAILGRTCDVWELKSAGTKVWVWKSIPLKSETRLMGQTHTLEAKRIEENPSIPEEAFQVPADIKLEDGPDIAKMMSEMSNAHSQPAKGSD